MAHNHLHCTNQQYWGSHLDISERLIALNGLLEHADNSTMIITNLLNIKYLTGFSGSAAFLIIKQSRKDIFPGVLLCTDGRYSTQAKMQLDNSYIHFADIFIGNQSKQIEAATKFIGRSETVSIEGPSTSLSEYQSWVETLSRAPSISAVKVETLRRKKDANEISLLATACQIADQALADCLRILNEKPTEIEFAAELEYKMRMLGADGPSFETIIASGPNSAMPHARPTSRKIMEGDAVVIDFGATYEGYHSDCTRTYFVGDPTSEFKLAYEAVTDSQLAGINVANLDVDISDVDLKCRGKFEENDLGDYFTHGTGHGVGLEIHELPWISLNSSEQFSIGDVFTVEPGLYFEGRLGVRIEDTLAITEAGVQQLTKVDKFPYL